MSEQPSQTILSGEINTATRSLHTTLNRLITSRLPLALPPHASDPSLYATGLLHFAHVFFTFESLWADLTQAPSDDPTSPLLSFLLVNPYDSPELFSTPPSAEMLQFLTTLRPKGLARSARLKNDLGFLTALHPTDLSVLLAQYPGEKVEEYCAHIRKAVRHKPHVLVAYAWCYYMAVFSGGRWIRAQLVAGGDDFWQRPTSDDNSAGGDEVAPLSERGLSLWYFDGPHDGENIKSDFKDRLAAAEELFSPSERIDVIEEAKTIFALSASLVDELDAKAGTQLQNLPHEAHSKKQDTKHTFEAGSQKSSLKVTKASDLQTWLKRPEVTGAVVALGCLACVAILRIVG
ncbi:heme oxygenase-like protein [Aaosphaeria arxii CBS 175.79]|uniref:Heme oxygenase-like protein n=1 Tax=Aaosphaeria arxii CBS 175.79 TaxID=1450172 RepID=A0A6A5XPI9_9PLEO|nr:heme oxygenase-like protein [Aaosphaeria arxii CBS 175.79]KAF2014826.1 heme oxygenase-like protein [Aaosphaeria arxii CBS 175.79]